MKHTEAGPVPTTTRENMTKPERMFMKHRSWGARLILNFSNSFVKLQGEMNESTVEIKYSATELKIVKAQKILSTNIPPGSKDHVLYLWG